MEEMTKWIFNKEYKKFKSSTINLPERLISDIPQGNRSIYIKEKTAKFLTSLECKYENSCKLFPSRSELVRCALLFDVLGNGHKVPKEIENPFKDVQKLEQYVKPPKQMIYIDKYEFNMNLIISILNEYVDMLSLDNLNELTGIHENTIRNTLKKIRVKYPYLIQRQKRSKMFVYTINRDVLKEIIGDNHENEGDKE